MRTAKPRSIAHLGPSGRRGRPPSARREHTAGMQPLVLRWPFGAEVRFGRSAVGAAAAVKRAGDPVVVQIPTGRDHLHLEREVARTLDLTQIRGSTRADQRFQLLLLASAHDLDLQIPAAGGPSRIVRCPAWRRRTGVLRHQHRQRPGWSRGSILEREVSPDCPAILHDPEPAATQAPWLVGSRRGPGQASPKAVQLAPGPVPFPLEKATPHVKDGLHVEIALPLPEPAERDVLGMAEQPGGLVIQRVHPFLEGADPECDRQCPALRPHGFAGRRILHRVAQANRLCISL